jgi:hypothetical protein
MPSPPLPFLMDDTIQSGSSEFIDIKHCTIIDELKDKRVVLFDEYVELKKIIGIAMVGVNHEVGAHFILSEHDLTYL